MSDALKFGEWQPIETAPKDRRILVFPAWGGEGNQQVTEARWRESKRLRRWEHFGYAIPREPTHWMPLPEPPK